MTMLPGSPGLADPTPWEAVVVDSSQKPLTKGLSVTAKLMASFGITMRIGSGDAEAGIAKSEVSGRMLGPSSMRPRVGAGGVAVGLGAGWTGTGTNKTRLKKNRAIAGRSLPAKGWRI